MAQEGYRACGGDEACPVQERVQELEQQVEAQKTGLAQLELKAGEG